MDPFHPYSCMHLELMHSVFQRTEWQLWVLLLVLPWAMGGAEQQKCLQILLSFRKIVAQKHTQLPCQTIPLLKLCWARLVEKHKRISFSCCNIWPDWNDTIFCTYCSILRSMWLHMNYESRCIPECNQPQELSYKRLGCRENHNSQPKLGLV